MRRLGPSGDDAQQPLLPSLHYQEAGGRLRALLNRAIQVNGLAVVDLEADTGIDEKQIGRALKDDGGAHPPLALLACVLAKDRAGIFITGLAELVGYEARPRSPDLAAENRRLREELAEIRARVESVLGGGP